MSRKTQTLTPDYFEGLYAADADPWKFASSTYELEKYARTLAALPEARYSSALEIGCSIGVLTQELADRCDRLFAVDGAATALEAARLRCAHRNNVEFAEMFVPRDWPQGAFDLILLSEVVYYFDASDLAELSRRVAKALAPRGTIILVHWTGETDYPLSGDQASELFMAQLRDEVDVVSGERRPQYRLDVLRRR
jgi:SAM-dependent methyltransferase